MLAKDIELPKLEIGDYIVIERCGAYGLTDSLVLFLSHGIPAEYLINDKNIFMIKPPQHGAVYLNTTSKQVDINTL